MLAARLLCSHDNSYLTAQYYYENVVFWSDESSCFTVIRHTRFLTMLLTDRLEIPVVGVSRLLKMFCVVPAWTDRVACCKKDDQKNCGKVQTLVQPVTSVALKSVNLAK